MNKFGCKGLKSTAVGFCGSKECLFGLVVGQDGADHHEGLGRNTAAAIAKVTAVDVNGTGFGEGLTHAE
jgi:hypothetical protein